jgi:hypothetical protein
VGTHSREAPVLLPGTRVRMTRTITQVYDGIVAVYNGQSFLDFEEDGNSVRVRIGPDCEVQVLVSEEAREHVHAQAGLG